MKSNLKRIILVFLFCLSACGVAEDNEVCFLKKMGKYEKNVLNTGLHFYNILTTDMICVDAKTQKYESSTDSYTKDMQTAKIKYFVNWSVDRDKAMTLHKTLGYNYNNRLYSETESAVKSIIGKNDSTFLISSREEVEKDITNILNERLKELNMTAHSVRIEDISYSSAYESAIEKKQVAQQEALTEKNKTEIAKQKAEQDLIKAKAEAEAMKIQTQALSQSKSLIEYERVQVEKIQAQKWDGRLPQNIYSGVPLPILNVNQ